MANIDDHKLVVRVAQGDELAFLALYDRYAAQVHALTLRILFDPMLAEEATQDTFLKLWNRAHQYKLDRGTVVIWLLTIARHTALDRLRLESRRPVLSGEEDPEEFWQFIPDTNTTSEESRWHSLYLTVQTLTPKYRQVIELAYYHHLSQSEIAETLGWPLGTVKTRIRAALEHLRRAWGEN